MMHFLRCERRFNVYEFECPHCGARGEVGVPSESNLAFEHGCGSNVCYIQRPAGAFTRPLMEEIVIQSGGVA